MSAISSLVNKLTGKGSETEETEPEDHSPEDHDSEEEEEACQFC